MSIIPTLGYKDYFRTNGGYSPWWLIVCYLVGAYIRNYGLPRIIAKRAKLFLVINIMVVVLSWNLLELLCGQVLQISFETRLFLRYTSPFTVVSAGLLLHIFSELGNKLKCESFTKKAVIMLSKSAFGVYLLHCHMAILDYVIGNRFGFIADLNAISAFIWLIVSCSSIYIICTLIDLLKQKIFRINSIANIINTLGDQIDKIIY